MYAVAYYMLATRGMLHIGDVAVDCALGVRQFERWFLTEVGVAPKLFSRVARFQSALDAKLAHRGRSWLEIAHDLSYHDQAHMIRDFRELAGNAPEKIFHGIGDLRPGALASPKGTTGSIKFPA
jgi:transcriptional regulator GlxA family with amidase domain